MRNACQWEDDKEKQSKIFKLNGQKSRKLFHGEHVLTIASVGGCSRLIEGLQQTLNRNRFASVDSKDMFDHIVVVTDRDEIGTEEDFIEKVHKLFQDEMIHYVGNICNNQWVTCEMENNMGESMCFSLLLMLLPFEENGAMETFLLNAIAQADSYDREIIEKCNAFVDCADPERRYLSKRRLITKAKFDAYFSIRTSAEQFTERHNILKNIKWENYTALQKDFILLTELSEK